MSSDSQQLSEDVQHQQVMQCSILHLLQEATKLPPPADEESSCLDNIHIQRDSSCCSSELTGSDRSSSAWEVMRLINLQCEWLLRSGCGDEEQVQTESSGITETVECSTSHSCCNAVACGSVPSDSHSEPAAVYSSQPTGDLRDESDEEDVEEPDGLAELIMKNTVENVCVSNRTENFLTENTSVLHETSGDERHSSDCVQGSERPGREISPVDFTFCLVSERDGENSWLPLNAYENTQASSAAASSWSTDLNNNLVESLDNELQEPEDIGEAPPSRTARGPCRRTQRKQLHPARSPDPRDPDLQGVTFRMHPELDASTHQCRLVITSNYSEEVRRFRKSRSNRSRSLQTSQRSSSSEEESDSWGPSRGKICASCRTRKTPLWRDAEDGTPLCNACGIRYKKYRVRCQHCWNIPKKDANTNSKCLKCGDALRLNSQQNCSSW